MFVSNFVVLANSTIWKVNRTKVACKDCGVGKFNDLEGQSDEAVACKDCVLANSTIWKVKEVACKDCGVGKFNNLEGAAVACKDCGVPPQHTATILLHNHNTQPGTYQTIGPVFCMSTTTILPGWYNMHR